MQILKKSIKEMNKIIKFKINSYKKNKNKKMAHII